jgi:acyl dehydratase
VVEPLRLTLDELRARQGTELGTSSWHLITQLHLNRFATATEDWERIHIDPQAAARTRLGTTIAHGLYTLALGPKLMLEIFAVHGHSLGLNYGYDSVRWLQPVPVWSRLRLRAELTGVGPVEGGSRFSFRQTFELEGSDRPACVANAIVAWFD